MFSCNRQEALCNFNAVYNFNSRFEIHQPLKKVVLHSDEEAEAKVVQKVAGTKVRRAAGLINGLIFLEFSHLTVTTIRFTVPEG
jgi:hypothetical protein